MGATAAVHPADQIVQSYGLGKLDDFSAEAVSRHVDGCATCQRRITEMSSDSFLDRLCDVQGRPLRTVVWSPRSLDSRCWTETRARRHCHRPARDRKSVV